MPSRRRSLLIAGCSAITALSGCQGLGQGQRPRIDLEIRNYTDEPQPLKLELLREDEPTRSEALVLDREYTVPASDGSDDSAGTTRTSDVVPERRYLVRVLLKNGRFETFHAHYYPAESNTKAIDFGIYRDETTENPFVDFRGLS
ncbi:hypothetical protein [Halorubrum tebenquichense]|uniref:hypothetical protein n=1 Tax=Halorubrum tebenquichense TaxID=119434 RepID=UPI000677866C|nr:hypothetical protein [Halorubrum tebenquichense]